MYKTTGDIHKTNYSVILPGILRVYFTDEME